MGACYSVPQDQVFLVESCGKFDRKSLPGFHCAPLMCCCVEEISGKISTRVQHLNVDVSTKTKDNVFVMVEIDVQFKVEEAKIYEANYKLSNPLDQIRAYVLDVVRSTVPKMTLEQVFESKEDISIAVKKELSAVMSSFGWFILQTLITDVRPDDVVKNAMNEINATKRKRLAAKEKAEADKLMVVKRAEGEAETKYLQGQGIARQRKAIVEGLRDSVQDFSGQAGGLPAREVLDLVLITQYFDTLKDLGQNSGKQTVFIPHNPGSLASLAEEIRSGVMSSLQKK